MRILLWLLLPVFALLIYRRTVVAGWKGTPARILGALLICVGLAGPVVPLILGGSILAPEMPATWLLVSEFFLFMVLFAGMFTVARDVLSFILWRARGVPFESLAQNRWLTVVALALGAVLNAYGIFHAVAMPEVKRVEVVLARLPVALDGLTVAQISDLHVSLLFKRDRVEAIVRAVNDLHPDLIAVTGDFVDGEIPRRAPDLEPLSNLRAPLGVWGCEGNHEHYMDYPGWRSYLPRLGIRMLFNSHAVIRTRGESFVIAGLTDYIADKFDHELPDLSKSLEGAPETFTLLLAHQPKLAPVVAGRGVDLQLAGHTHGGQLPGTNLLIKLLNAGFLAGLYEVKPEDGKARPMALYVNSGTQLWNGFAVRIGTTGEITLLTLRSGKKLNLAD